VSHRDPLHPGKAAANLGGAALARGAGGRWELADVLSYNSATHTSVVRTHSGRPLRDVPQIKSGPGEFEHLETGSMVVVTYDLGFPAILGCLSLAGGAQGLVSPVAVTGVAGVGDDNPLQPTMGTNNYKPPFAPTDLTQGDWARVGTMGNHVAVLEGGVASLGSPTALVRSLGLSGLLQLIARRVQVDTDFGEWHTENDQGRTSFVLRGGANQSTQTGADEQHWTVRLDLGATGDLFRFEITEPDGRTTFRFHVTGDGRVQIYGDGGVDLSSGTAAEGLALQDIAGGRALHVAKDDELTIGGGRSTRVERTDETSIATDKTTVIGASETRFVNSDQTLSVGGQKVEVIAGGPAPSATPGNLAVSTKLVNGGWQVDIGNAADGANIAALAGYLLRTSLGDIALDAGGAMMLKARQTVDLDGLLIHLGGATHPLPKFDTFLSELSEFLGALLIVLQGGTAGSPVAQQIVALPAAMPRLQEFVQRVALGLPFQSTKVRND
jgi:hypothetical protein